MTAQAALQGPVTPMALEAVVAAVLVAALVTVGLALGYTVVTTLGAWALVLVIGLVRLVWMTVRGAGRSVGAHLHRAPARLARITPETVSDLQIRPSG